MTSNHVRRLTIYIVCAAIIVCANFGTARASSPAPESPKKVAATADDLHHWAKQLDSDSFAKREEAAKKLFDAGESAIDPLVGAAEGKSMEATTAAVDILRRLSQSTDRSTSDGAKAALEKLAKSNHTAAANLAKEALAPAKSPNAQLAGPNGPIQFGGGIQLGGNVQIGGGQIQIFGGNLQAIPGGGMQVLQFQGGNGSQTIDVDENGRKVHIEEDPNGIEMRVTKTENGQDKVEKFKAKNAAELKQKYPEASKLYEQYAQNGAGGVQILGGLPNIGVQLPGPAQLAPAPPPAATDDKSVAEKIDEARKLINEASDGLKQTSSKASANNRKAIDDLSAANQKLDEAQRKLER